MLFVTRPTRERRRGLAWAAAAAWLLAAPVAASPSETITVGFLPWAGYGEWSDVMRDLLKQFLADHPGVAVREFQNVWLPREYYEASGIMSTAAAAGPDVVWVDTLRLGDWVREGLVQPVDELVEAWPGKARLLPAWRESLKVEGHEWGIAEPPRCAILIVSGAAVGGAPPALKAWDDVTRLAARLTTTKRAGLGLQRGWGVAGLWYALAREGGMPEPTLGPEGHLAFAMADEAGVRAAEFIRDQGAAIRAGGGRITFTDDGWGLTAALTRDEVALILTDTGEAWRDGNVRSTHAALAPVPSPSGGVLGWPVSGTITALPGWVKDRARRDLLWDYAISVSEHNPAFDRALLEKIQKTGTPPGANTMLNNPDHAAVRAMPPGWAAALRTALTAIKGVPPYNDVREMSARLGPGLERLIQEGGDARAVVSAAQKAYDDEVRLLTRRSSSGWRNAAYGGLALLALVLLVSVGLLVRTLMNEVKLLRSAGGAGLAREAVPVLLVLFLPGLLLSLIFAAGPLLRGLQMSTLTGVLRDGGKFAGLSNYFEVLINPLTHTMALNTVRFLGWSFLLGFVAPLVLALILSGLRRLQLVARTLFFLPAVANAVVIALLWEQLYAPAGFMNRLLGFLGVQEIKWLEDPGWAMFATVLAQAWSTLGVSGLIYLAGLSTIPESLYEEAELSGASLAERFTTVTWPHLKPLVGISFVGWLLAAGRTSEHILLLTAGGPGKATYVLGLDIFTQAYVKIQFGYAMAEVWLLVALILVLAIYQMRAVREGQLRVG